MVEKTVFPLAADPTCEALWTANMAVLNRRFPAVHAQLADLGPPHSTLVRVGADDWDVEFQGTALYGMGGRAYAALHPPTKEQCLRIRLGSLLPESADGPSRSLHQRLTALLHDHALDEQTVMARPSREAAYHVISLGLGLGFHLAELIARTECRSLILVETNPDFLFYALRVLDWEALTAPLDHLALITAIHPEHAVIGLQTAVAQASVVALDGLIQVIAYPSSAHVAIGNAFATNTRGIHQGLGFMDDDVRMIRNAYLNLKPDPRNDTPPLIWHSTPTPRDWPVIIVGSGPSLDASIDDLKRNAPHALIVAAGTAVPALLNNGIVPDFCTILENTPDQYDLFEGYARRWPDAVRRIVLLASCTVDPRLPPLFDRAVLAMRDGVASHALFCQHPEETASIAPTVANMALFLFLLSGYRDIVLFGVDLGGRTAAQHHARQTPWTDGTLPADITQALVHDMSIRTRGNFGGMIVCDSYFEWARDAMERLIAKWPGPPVSVRNCSDGAMIKGTLPTVPRKLNLPAPATNRTEAVTGFLKDFAPYPQADFSTAWDKDRFLGTLEKLRHHLLSAADTTGTFDPMIAVETIVREKNSVPSRLLRGTLTVESFILSALNNRLDPAERRTLWPSALAFLRADIDSCAANLAAFFSDLDAGKTCGPWLRTPLGEPSEW